MRSPWMLFLYSEAFYVSVENDIISAIPGRSEKIRINRERDKNGRTGTGPDGSDALPD